MKRSLQIVVLIIISVAFGVAGYVIPIDKFGLDLSSISNHSNEPENEPAKPTVSSQQLQIIELRAFKKDENLYGITVRIAGDESDTLECSVVAESTRSVVATAAANPNKAFQISDIHATENESYKLVVNSGGNNPQSVEQPILGIVYEKATAPIDIKAVVAERRSKEPNKVNRTVTVFVDAALGEMECIIQDVNTKAEVRKGAMTNGKVSLSVPPVDGGEYLIVVRNVATGAESSITKGGFDKIKKWGAADVESQLNGQRDAFLRHHFDLAKLRLTCVAGSESVSSFDELLEVQANGGIVRVVESPRYDKYNRIINLTVSIAY